MSLIASLDIGTDKMVMAVATEEEGVCRLSGIRMIVSKGVEEGKITDRTVVAAYIRSLVEKLAKDTTIDCLNIALSGRALHASDRKETVPLRKRVRESDLDTAEENCQENGLAQGEELVELVPVAYAVDGNYVANPVGMAGRSLDVRFRVYAAESSYLAMVKEIATACGVREVVFYPPVRGYEAAFGVSDRKNPFALIDMGATHTGVYLFRNGGLRHEADLPLGTQTIEADIAAAYAIDDLSLAKKIKQQYGVAVRALCKNDKIDISDIKKRIERRDLSKIIQSRMEELLEGAVFQLQQWHFTEADKEIALTGGGSRMIETEALLARLSGQSVVRMKAGGVETAKEELLEAPACALALGLLSCRNEEPEEKNEGMGGWFGGLRKRFLS